MIESERLARNVFDALEHGEYRRLIDLMHPEAIVVPAADPDQAFDRERFVAFLQKTIASKTAATYEPLDDTRVIVTGRIRWPVPSGGHRDSAAVWAMTFRDGLLYRQWPAASVEDAARALDDSLLG